MPGFAWVKSIFSVIIWMIPFYASINTLAGTFFKKFYSVSSAFSSAPGFVSLRKTFHESTCS